MKPALLASTALALMVASPATADSLRNASQAVGDSADAGSRIVAAGGQIALGAVAIPLAASGALTEASGKAATEISEDLWATANAPLTVDDRVVMPQPAPNVPRLPETGDGAN